MRTCECENRDLKDDEKWLRCECGCETILISVTDKTPKNGICERCRKDVDLNGTRLVLTR